MVLRPYQDKAVSVTRNELEKHRKVCLVLPTGAGKTVIAANMIKSALRKGKRCVFFVHRIELLRQTVAALKSHGIYAGVLTRDKNPKATDNVIVGMVTTAARRIPLHAIDLVIVDEAHHATAPSWKQVIDSYPAAYIVGLTATPQRLDGKGLDNVFDKIIAGATTAQLIADGYLAEFDLYVPEMLWNREQLTKARGDYTTKSIVAQAPNVLKKLVDHMGAVQTPALVFLSDVETSKQLAEALPSAAHLDGKTGQKERLEVIEQWAAGSIEILCNVGLFGEGLDLPRCATVVLARPTASLTVYLQQCGRVLRPLKGKRAKIVDLAGNVFAHGLPDEVHNWVLSDAVKLERTPNALMAVGKEGKIVSKPVEVTAALKQVKEMVKKTKSRASEVWRAGYAGMSRKDLVELSVECGYSRKFGYFVWNRVRTGA